MKIAKVETVWVSIPFHHGGTQSSFGGKVWRNLDTLLIRVETDTGIVGWGEAFGHNAIPSTKAAFDSMIAPLVIGRDATRITELTLDLQKTLHNFGRYGQTLFAIGGLDIALWDIAGKAASLPLHRLIGGARRDTLPVYASLLRYGDPEVVAERTSAAVAEGYGMVKLHERTVEALDAARDAGAPDTEIMVDVNCPWSVQESIDMAAAFAPFDVYWLEEPVWPPENYEGLADVRRQDLVPIAAGENACSAWEFKVMLETGAVDYAQPSVTKVGGVTEMLKVARLAELHNVSLAPHSPYFGPGFVATLHLCAATEGPVERFYGKLEAPIFGDLTEPVDGHLPIPDGPGLGRDPDPDVLKDYRVKEG